MLKNESNEKFKQEFETFRNYLNQRIIIAKYWFYENRTREQRKTIKKMLGTVNNVTNKIVHRQNDNWVPIKYLKYNFR